MKHLKLHFLLWVIASFATTAAWSATVVEGQEYLRLRNPQPVETGKKIEVIEFFSYGCPHCSDLEPILQTWLVTLPQDVQFRRVPVMFQQRWEALAKIYYTLEAMGDEGRLSPDVFKAIHGDGVTLYDTKTFLDWAASHGLDRARVAEVYGSFGVNSRFNRAKALAQTYNIQSVPTLVVDGKFVTLSLQHAAVPGVLDALIAKARAERGKT